MAARKKRRKRAAKKSPTKRRRRRSAKKRAPAAPKRKRKKSKKARKKAARKSATGKLVKMRFDSLVKELNTIKRQLKAGISGRSGRRLLTAKRAPRPNKVALSMAAANKRGFYPI